MPHVELVRLRAEAALLRRLNAGYGFADSRIPAEVFLRDEAARKRLGNSPLRPRETHAAASAELEDLIAPAQAELERSDSRLASLIRRLELSPAEAWLVSATTAYAVDVDVRQLFGVLAGRRAPGLFSDVCRDVAPDISARDWFSALHPAGRIVAWRMITSGPGAGRIDGELEATPSLVHWVLGDDRIASAIAPVVELLSIEDDVATYVPSHVAADIDRVVGLLGPTGDLGAVPSAVLIKGAQGAGKRAAAHAIAIRLGRPLIAAPLPALADTDPAGGVRDALAEALLRDAVAYLPGIESIDPATRDGRLHIDAIDRHPGLCLLATRDAGLQSLPIRRPFHLIRFPSPSLDVRRRAWSQVVPAATADVMAARYVIGPGAIGEVARDAEAFARAAGREPTTDDIEASVSRKLTLNLGPFASRITRRARFGEMVLPDDVVTTLRDMVAMVRERSKILEAWGYGRHLGLSRGVSALFSGEPGTGKTMAASAISSELGLELFRIDLAAVVSKFIGETEKHLARIFDEAQSAEAMLLFDEADSLFGKRTEVKSSTDRYANLEINYILQRMDSFNGISVLTTNHESAIDQAFMRRLNFRVRFPKPEAEEREQLWRTLLPPETALGDDVDFSALADKFEMTGGHIRNAIVRAAVIAAREGRQMQPGDLVEGAQLEYYELGKVMSSLGT